MAGPIGVTCEPRDKPRAKRLAGVPVGVGDEYADSVRRTPPLASRLTGPRQTPTDAARRQVHAGGPFCHAANRERRADQLPPLRDAN
jgi:hypothetical protein